MSEEKQKALETAIVQLERQFGKGAVMRLGQTAALNVEAVSTGSITLDYALGIGGVPKGRIIEIFGPESSGKTTVALHVVAEAQKSGGSAVFIDVEHALEICEALVRSGAIDVVVIDSVAAMVTKAEIEGEMGDSHVGVQARLMSQALRKLTGAISKSNCVAIFINQLREKIGVMYGNPETTPGGRALKFYSSVRIDVRRIEGIKQGGEIIGNRTKAKIVKNKVAPPFKEAQFDILYGHGISKDGELLDLAVEMGFVQKSGSWFSYNEQRLGQGRDNIRDYIKNNPEFAAELEKLVRENMNKVEPTTGKKGSIKKSDASADIEVQ